MNHLDPDELVPAVHARSEFEAHAQAAILREEGIESAVFAGERSWMGGGSLNRTEVPVMVRREDAERARQLLTQRIADSVDLDWDEVDVGEREDALPLRETGRTPWPARLALGAVLLLAALVLLMLIVNTID